MYVCVCVCVCVCIHTYIYSFTCTTTAWAQSWSRDSVATLEAVDPKPLEEEASFWSLVPPLASRSRSSTSLVRCTSLFSVLKVAPWSQVRGEDAGREGAGITAFNREAISCMIYEEEDT